MQISTRNVSGGGAWLIALALNFGSAAWPEYIKPHPYWVISLFVIGSILFSFPFIERLFRHGEKEGDSATTSVNAPITVNPTIAPVFNNVFSPQVPASPSVVLSEPSRDYRSEWFALAEKHRGNCHFLRADWTGNNILGESWRVAGGKASTCEAWLRQAGALLLRSPNVRATLSKKVAAESDDLYRWLSYMKENGHFRSSPYWGTGTTDDGCKEIMHSGQIPDLASESETACIKCATKES